jgi:hypothetical protein
MIMEIIKHYIILNKEESPKNLKGEKGNLINKEDGRCELEIKERIYNLPEKAVLEIK